MAGRLPRRSERSRADWKEDIFLLIGDDDRDLLPLSSSEVSGQAISISTGDVRIRGELGGKARLSSFANILIEQRKIWSILVREREA